MTDGNDAAGRDDVPAPREGVHIRLAETEADIEAMIELGARHHAESRFRIYPYDRDRLLAAGRNALAKRNPGVIIAERDGELVGMAVVMLGEYFFSPTKTATVQLFYVVPEARGGRAVIKLLHALRHWSHQTGAQDLHINVTSGIDLRNTDRIFRKLGFKHTGGNYVLEELG